MTGGGEQSTMIAIQLILYCALFTAMVRFAVRGGAIEGLYFYPKAVQALLFLEVMNWYDGIAIDKIWVGYSKFWILPGCEEIPYVQTWKQMLKKRELSSWESLFSDRYGYCE